MDIIFLNANVAIPLLLLALLANILIDDAKRRPVLEQLTIDPRYMLSADRAVVLVEAKWLSWVKLGPK